MSSGGVIIKSSRLRFTFQCKVGLIQQQFLLLLHTFLLTALVFINILHHILSSVRAGRGLHNQLSIYMMKFCVDSKQYSLMKHHFWSKTSHHPCISLYTWISSAGIGQWNSCLWFAINLMMTHFYPWLLVNLKLPNLEVLSKWPKLTRQVKPLKLICCS